jgi:signal transduction histidine kinase
VLTLYGHQLRGGFEVVRDYTGETVIEAMHDRLNQVWTNLIHNALQSMGTHGTLTLTVRTHDDETVTVGVGDTGPGVPPEVGAQIWKPFFTTKPTGQGSGLGLSICKDIVDAHRGTISYESAPGRTTFTVRLPIKAQR